MLSSPITHSLIRHLPLPQRTRLLRLRLSPTTPVLQRRRFPHRSASEAAGREGKDFGADGVESFGVSLVVQAVDGESVAAIHVDSGEVGVWDFAAALGLAHFEGEVEGEGGVE